MLLVDENELRKFYDAVIPELKDTECLIMLLCARKKYYPELARSEEVLRREVLRERDWDKFLRKVRKLTTVEDLYVDKNGKTIPIDAFGVYIVLDPKDAIKTWFALQKEMNELLYQYVRGDDNAIRQLKRIDVRWFSCLHRSKSRKVYWLVDIDDKHRIVLKDVIDTLGKENIVWISETRGGYHVIVRANDDVAKKLFKDKILEAIGVEYKTTIELHKEPMTPIPGCLQGGFLVKGFSF